MKHIDDIADFPRLFLGLFLCSLCTVFAIHSNLGLSPWGVFHQGISKTVGITFGQASIISSFIIILAVDRMGLKIGLGTVFYVFGIGVFINVVYKIMKFDITSIHHKTFDKETLRFMKG